MNMTTNPHGAAAPTFRVTLLLAAFLWAGSAFAQWTWLDKDGRKVFSDTAPPAGTPEKSILKRPGGGSASNTVAAAPKAPAGTDDAAKAAANPASAASAPLAAASAPKLSTVDKDLEKKKKEKEDAEAAKRKEEEQRIAKLNIENCARAKSAKSTLDSGVRIAVTNAKGEREVMEDAARAAEAKRVQGIIDAACK